MFELQTIWLRADAPPKPPAGAACNGCGICCASEPCPVGMIVSGRRRGRCRALAWSEGGKRYRCALLRPPAAAHAHVSPLRRWRETLLRRWIGVGVGCDSTAKAGRAPAPGHE
jgi:hypothetical protein